mgnify:CR=1 FL=1
MKKTKVLYTIPNFNTAGSGKVLYDLANGLDKSKFDVQIACSSREGIFFNEVEKLNLPIHIIETTCKLRPYWNVLSRIKPYKNFIKNNNFNTYFESDEDYKSLSDKAFDVLAKGETSLDEIYSILLNI